MAIRTTPFLLGGSRALQNWIAQDKRNTQVNQYNTQQQKEFDANLAKSYNTNRIKTPIGQAYQQEILSDVQKLNDVGAKYLAQGFDVYNPNFRDPKQVAAHNQYLQDKAMVESKIAARSDYEKTVDAERKEYQKNPYGFDNTPDDVYSQFEKSNTLNDIVNKGIQYPSLQRTFDYNKNVTEQIPVLTTETEKIVGDDRITERVANVPVITSFTNKLLTTGPNRNWVEKQIGGSVDGLLNTIDKSVIKKALDSEFRSPTSLDMMAELKNKGKVPAFGTPQYEKFLDDAVNEQLKAEEKFDKILSGAVQDGIAKANPSYKKVKDFSVRDQQLQEESAARARRAEQREITRFNERNDPKGGETELYRQQLVDGMFDGTPGSGEELASVIFGQGGYSKPVTYNTRVPGKLTITIPERVTSVEKQKGDGTLDYTETITPPRTMTFNTGSRADKLKLNQLISDVTGERITPSKFVSGNAGGKVDKAVVTPPKSAPKSISRSELSSRASASGYSTAEYEKLLKAKGITIK